MTDGAKDWLKYVAPLVAVLAMAASYAAWIRQEARDIATQAMESTNKAVGEVKEQVRTLGAKVDNNQHTGEEANGEVRKDVQAIYKYMLTRQKQERLEGEVPP